MSHEDYMRRCLELAHAALERDEVPVGAVVVDGDRIVGEGVESTRASGNPAAHAEVRAVEAACLARGATTLPGATMYSTVEPCVLCGYVARTVGLGAVVYGVPAGRLGACTSSYALLLDASVPGWGPPPLILQGVLQEDCAALLDEYARRRRSTNR